MVSETGRNDSYQSMLRALGTLLDEEPSCRIAVTEVSDGFVVRTQRSVHTLEPRVRHFDRATLNEQFERLRNERRRTADHVRHPGIWTQLPGGHREFLRSLGFELDEVSAHGIVIEELEDGIVLTYNYPDSETKTWRKRMVVLGVSEIEEVLNTAFKRRGKGPQS
jgi:hypothetical protein